MWLFIHQQAHVCESRIDRNTIDQIKSLKNPPRLVGTIMELMLTLLQQFGTGSCDQEPTVATSEDSSASTPGRLVHVFAIKLHFNLHNLVKV